MIPSSQTLVRGACVSNTHADRPETIFEILTTAEGFAEPRRSGPLRPSTVVDRTNAMPRRR